LTSEHTSEASDEDEEDEDGEDEDGESEDETDNVEPGDGNVNLNPAEFFNIMCQTLGI